MAERLKTVQRFIEKRLAPQAFEITREGEELHLSKAGECFVRLIPTASVDQWRMEYFRNLERWEIIDFQGALEECLEYLLDSEHYRFWEG